MNTELYNNFFGLNPFILLMIPIGVVIGIVYFPLLFTRFRCAREYISPQRIASALWFGLIIFVLLVDGHFIETGIAQHIIYAGVGINGLHLIFSHLKEFDNFKLRKGDWSIEADGNMETKGTKKHKTIE
jgi:hypothetical protein